MENFTPLPAFFGGVLIGLSMVFLMLANGRIAGVGGVVGGLLAPKARDTAWRLAFLVGLAAPPLLAVAAGGVAPVTVTHSTWSLIAGGLFVGFGARLGGGCTSGHGVAALARLSPLWRGCRRAPSWPPAPPSPPAWPPRPSPAT